MANKKVTKDGITFEVRDELDLLRLKKAGYVEVVEEKTPAEQNEEAVKAVNEKAAKPKGGK